LGPPSAARAKRRAPLDQPAVQAARRRDADLLADDGAHRDLEAVPAPRHPNRRPRRHQRRQAGIAGQTGVDVGKSGIEVEHPAQPEGGAVHGDAPGKAQGRDEAVPPRILRHLEGPVSVAQADGAAIGCPLHRLNPLDGAQTEERQHRRPVVRRFVGQPQDDAGGGRSGRLLPGHHLAS